MVSKVGKKFSRRDFLKTSKGVVGALAVPWVVPSSVLRGAVPSEQITLGVIGMGHRCEVVLKHFMINDDLRCLAVCDAQEQRRMLGKKMVDDRYNNNDCVLYKDIPEILARKDIDAILIATGDRMHAVGSIMAAKAGKDIYSEKPMSLTIEEGRALVEAVDRYGTVYQCGHQRRSVDSYKFQVEVVQSGMIGKVHTVQCRTWKSGVIAPQEPQPVPEGLDYETWLGPTPYHPYIPAKVLYGGWNYFWDTGGGIMIGMGCHYTDITQWGLDKDDTGPIHYKGTAEYAEKCMSDTPMISHVTCTYADGKKILIESEGPFGDRFIRFIGDEGWIQVDDQTNVVTAEPKSILTKRGISARGWDITNDHVRNFMDCMRTRQETTCSPEKSHRATTVCHAANICLRLGREVRWDPQKEQFVNDNEANRMISRAMRPPWTL